MSSNFRQNGFCKLHDEKWAEKQRVAGKCVAAVLNNCRDLVEQNIPGTSLRAFEEITETIIAEFDCQATFWKYKGFPNKLCVSINNTVVHGTVSDYTLKDSDVVKFDFGATFEGSIADAAITCVVGNHPELQKLSDTCEKALALAIKSVRVGKQIGVIGSTIHKFVKDSGYGSIVSYGGHGIGSANDEGPHAYPFISNKSEENEGIRIQPGFSFAIEPQLLLGRDTKTIVSKEDGWSVIANSPGVHWENSLFIFDDHLEIMTFTGKEKYLESNIIKF